MNGALLKKSVINLFPVSKHCGYRFQPYYDRPCEPNLPYKFVRLFLMFL
jgi:hypothetical protein